ncbi:MAG: potassium channel family protein, partial [Halodesulfurarchaeum sp.]
YGNLKGSNELGKHRLAALIDVGTVLGLGLGGLLLVIVIMVLIRPAVALIATYGVEKFTGPERLFLGAMGPRGIIPASVATLFAIELELAGNVAAGQTLLGTVFVVILATDVIEAGFARQIADRLGVTPMRTIIVGGGRVGRALATRLENSGEFVVIVEQDEERKVMAEDHGFTVIHGDGTEGADLRQAGIENAKVVVAATGKDDVNLLVSQIAKTKFGIADLYAKVNEPENDDAFESLGVAAVNAPDATAFAIENAIERQELANWMYDHGDDHAIREVTVTSQSMIGKSIRDLNDAIPGGCLIAELGEGVDAHVPDSDEKLEYGDKVTFLGDSVAVERAANRFHPHE